MPLPRPSLAGQELQWGLGGCARGSLGVRVRADRAVCVPSPSHGDGATPPAWGVGLSAVWVHTYGSKVEGSSGPYICPLIKMKIAWVLELAAWDRHWIGPAAKRGAWKKGAL